MIVEAGDASKGDGGPNGVGTEKDVAIRADRADGFVLKNVKVRHAKEHGIYVLESDGYLLTHFKAYYNGLYGTLTFVEDHGVQQHCDAVGHGDSGVYPGAAVETGAQRPEGTQFRYNQEVRFCDLHHNMAGYSGTNGNAVHVHHNSIYDNALGLQTDVVTGAGHPGYPGDSMLVENNHFYSNNFNVYEEDSSVNPAFPFPVGTGLWIAGGNRHQVRNNYFYDNWRRGTMLFSVPDQLVCGEAADGNQQAGCDPNGQTTSFDNSHYENRMGFRPDGTADPNGTDFWWDPYPGTTGNCWWDNRRRAGREHHHLARARCPTASAARKPEQSSGTGNPAQTGELAELRRRVRDAQLRPERAVPVVQDAAGAPAEGRLASSASARSASSGPTTVVLVPGRVYRSSSGSIDRRATSAASTAPTGTPRATPAARGSSRRSPSSSAAWSTTRSRSSATATRSRRSRPTTCSTRRARKPYAQGFVLYKLYTYAAAVTDR